MTVQHPQASVIHHTNKTKDKARAIILAGAENVSEKVQHPFVIKKQPSHQSEHGGNIPRHNKGHT